MKIYKYRHKHRARKMQMRLKRMYGYKPRIIHVRTPRTRALRYVVVRPSGLRRI